MSTGQRDKFVTLDGPGVAVPDPDGGFVEGWAPLDPPTAYAYINPATARDLERAASGTVITTASHLIELAYHPGVTTAARIQYDDPEKGLRTFQITSVRNPDEARRDLVIVAEELQQ
jgi:head-tail adaptor